MLYISATNLDSYAYAHGNTDNIMMTTEFSEKERMKKIWSKTEGQITTTSELLIKFVDQQV